jgi:hypothetical protein
MYTLVYSAWRLLMISIFCDIYELDREKLFQYMQA